MTEGVPHGHFGLIKRILVAMTLLVLVIYGTAVAVLGTAQRNQMQQHLRVTAEREWSAIQTAIQDQVLLRDYAAIENTIRNRVQSHHLLEASYVKEALVIRAVSTPHAHPYPAWFARLTDLQPVQTHGVLQIGGVDYGVLSVSIAPEASIHALWMLLKRLTELALGSLAAAWLLMSWLLKKSLRGLLELRAAARAIQGGDLGARARLVRGSPPEIRETKLAFNRMADHVNELVIELERGANQLAIEKERLRITLASIGDAVLVTDAEGRVEFINPKAEELTGFDSERAGGLHITEVMPLVDEATGNTVANPLDAALNQDVVAELDTHTLIRRRNGTTLAISDTAAPIHAADGKVTGGVLVFHDESERRSLMQRLVWQAERDHLTGLWNRRTMEDKLAAALYSAQHESRHFVFCYIDLDRFKLVNDTCGHRAGDALLQRLTAIMARRVEGESHYLARLGGDEFGLLFVDTTLSAALNPIQALRDEIGRFRFDWEDKVFRLGVSLGVTELHAGMKDVGDILAQADTACYHAKSLGGNAIQVYEKAHPALQKISDEMHWITVITRAFEDHRFVLFRQEKVALRDDPCGRHYEVLIRMRGEDGAIISPGEFLPAAERYGLAPSFDRWVVRNVFAYLDTHPEDTACYALNLSGRSLSDASTADFILEEISHYHFDPTRISFEVTETAAIDNLDTCERLILTLKSRGIHFALDDFGRGQSSFGYLKRLPVASLKIDGDFVRGLDTDREKLAIVKAMHTLAHELGKETIAEQVETEAELACLRGMGVDFVQGYLLSKPAPLPV